MKKIILFFSILLTTSLITFASDFIYNTNKIPNPIKNNSWIIDCGNYTTKSEQESINTLIDQIEKETTVEIAVVIVPNTGGDIFTAAQALFDKWKIGKKENNNGILLLISMEERQFRTHTGYGIEGILPDAECRHLQEQYIVPNFRSGQYALGIQQYLKVIFEILKNPNYLAEQEKIEEQKKQKEIDDLNKYIYLRRFNLFISSSSVGLFFFIIGVILLIFSIINARKKLHESMCSYSFIEKVKVYGISNIPQSAIYILFIISAIAYLVGSRFLEKWQAVPFIIPALGIIATIITYHVFQLIQINIIKIWRNHPRNCPECNQPMKKLGEDKEDPYLSQEQLLEEDIKSKDYDVWICSSCNTKTIEDFEGKNYNLYTTCPKCSRYTSKITGSKILKDSTYTETGEKEVNFHCENCKNNYKKIVTISIKIHYTYDSPSNYSYSSYRSYSSSSGSFSRSSSYTSSSTSRSFGGGSSGGGGATSSW